MGFKNCSSNEYMNEFVVILKLINLKKWVTEKSKFWKLSNSIF